MERSKSLQTSSYNTTYGFPILKFKASIKEAHGYFSITPICLSGPQENTQVQSFLSSCGSSEDFLGCYVQTRIPCENLDESALARGSYHVGFRTVYYIYPGLDIDGWLKKMKPDARARMNKALNAHKKRQLEIKCYDFIEQVPPQTINEIDQIYSKLALKNGFSDQYRFNFSNFYQLGNDPYWRVHVVYSHDEVVGFCIIGLLNGELDYTFAAANPNTKLEINRLLLFSAFELSNKMQLPICIGGGLREGDQLSQFKLRSGLSPLKLANFKFASKKYLDAVGLEHFDQAKQHRWPLV